MPWTRMFPMAVPVVLVLLAGAVPGARVASLVKSRSFNGMSSSFLRPMTSPSSASSDSNWRACAWVRWISAESPDSRWKVLSDRLPDLKQDSGANLRLVAGPNSRGFVVADEQPIQTVVAVRGGQGHEDLVGLDPGQGQLRTN